MGNFLTSMVTVLTAIIGVAIIAVLVSKNAQTPQVLNSFWGGFSGALQTAASPVAGGVSTLQNNTFSANGSGSGLSLSNFLPSSLANMA